MWDLCIVLGAATQKMQQLPSNFFRLQDVELLSNQLLELSGGFRGPKSDERLLLIRAINEKRLTSHGEQDKSKYSTPHISLQEVT